MWNKHETPDGKIYFHNTKTSETSWVVPEGYVDGEVLPPPENMKDGPPLNNDQAESQGVNGSGSSQSKRDSIRQGHMAEEAFLPVKNLLTSVGLGTFVEKFRDHGITTLGQCADGSITTDNTLMDVIGMKKVHVNKFRRAIAEHAPVEESVKPADAQEDQVDSMMRKNRQLQDARKAQADTVGDRPIMKEVLNGAGLDAFVPKFEVLGITTLAQLVDASASESEARLMGPEIAMKKVHVNKFRRAVQSKLDEMGVDAAQLASSAPESVQPEPTPAAPVVHDQPREGAQQINAEVSASLSTRDSVDTELLSKRDQTEKLRLEKLEALAKDDPPLELRPSSDFIPKKPVEEPKADESAPPAYAPPPEPSASYAPPPEPVSSGPPPAYMPPPEPTTQPTSSLPTKMPPAPSPKASLPSSSGLPLNTNGDTLWKDLLQDADMSEFVSPFEAIGVRSVDDLQRLAFAPDPSPLLHSPVNMKKLQINKLKKSLQNKAGDDDVFDDSIRGPPTLQPNDTLLARNTSSNTSSQANAASPPPSISSQSVQDLVNGDPEEQVVEILSDAGLGAFIDALRERGIHTVQDLAQFQITSDDTAVLLGPTVSMSKVQLNKLRKEISLLRDTAAIPVAVAAAVPTRMVGQVVANAVPYDDDDDDDDDEEDQQRASFEAFRERQTAEANKLREAAQEERQRQATLAQQAAAVRNQTSGASEPVQFPGLGSDYHRYSYSYQPPPEPAPGSLPPPPPSYESLIQPYERRPVEPEPRAPPARRPLAEDPPSPFGQASFPEQTHHIQEPKPAPNPPRVYSQPLLPSAAAQPGQPPVSNMNPQPQIISVRPTSIVPPQDGNPRQLDSQSSRGAGAALDEQIRQRMEGEDDISHLMKKEPIRYMRKKASRMTGKSNFFSGMNKKKAGAASDETSPAQNSRALAQTRTRGNKTLRRKVNAQVLAFLANSQLENFAIGFDDLGINTLHLLLEPGRITDEQLQSIGMSRFQIQKFRSSVREALEFGGANAISAAFSAVGTGAQPQQQGLTEEEAMLLAITMSADHEQEEQRKALEQFEQGPSPPVPQPQQEDEDEDARFQRELRLVMELSEKEHKQQSPEPSAPQHVPSPPPVQQRSPPQMDHRPAPPSQPVRAPVATPPPPIQDPTGPRHHNKYEEQQYFEALVAHMEQDAPPVSPSAFANASTSAPHADTAIATKVGAFDEITEMDAESIAMAALDRFTRLFPEDQPAAFMLLQMIASVCEEMAGEDDLVSNRIFNIAYYLAWNLARQRVTSDALVQVFQESLMPILEDSLSMEEGKSSVDRLIDSMAG